MLNGVLAKSRAPCRGFIAGACLQTAELSVHEGPVWQVAWSHPSYGTLLASCGYDRRVVIQREVSPGNWVRIYTYEDHQSSGALAAPLVGNFNARVTFPSRLPAARKPLFLPLLLPLPCATRCRLLTTAVNSVSWAPHEYGLQLAAASSDGKVSVLTHRGARCPRAGCSVLPLALRLLCDGIAAVISEESRIIALAAAFSCGSLCRQ